MSRNSNRRERQSLFDKQKGICWLCKCPMTLEESSIDHVIPQKFGGQSGPKMGAHKICNSIRGHDMTERLPGYYQARREYLEKRMIIRNEIRRNREMSNSIPAAEFQLFLDDVLCRRERNQVKARLKWQFIKQYFKEEHQSDIEIEWNHYMMGEMDPQEFARYLNKKRNYYRFKTPEIVRYTPTQSSVRDKY